MRRNVKNCWGKPAKDHRPRMLFPFMFQYGLRCLRAGAPLSPALTQRNGLKIGMRCGATGWNLIGESDVGFGLKQNSVKGRARLKSVMESAGLRHPGHPVKFQKRARIIAEPIASGRIFCEFLRYLWSTTVV